MSRELAERLLNALIAEDEALNALGGGSPRETISGTAGRACGEAGGKPYWWGPLLRALIEVQPWFGKGHCAREAAKEQARRDAQQ